MSHLLEGRRYYDAEADDEFSVIEVTDDGTVLVQYDDDTFESHIDVETLAIGLSDGTLVPRKQ